MSVRSTISIEPSYGVLRMVCLDQQLGLTGRCRMFVYAFLQAVAKQTSRLAAVMFKFVTRSIWLGARRFLVSPPCRRCLASWKVHPSIHSFTESLIKTQPKFSLSPNKLQILSEPEQFYRALLVSFTLFILADILACCHIGYD